MNAKYAREVKLSGEELEKARSVESEFVSSLNSMVGLIIDAMEGRAERTVTVHRASYDMGVHVLIVHGPESCYVYDGDAGVCRPCTPEEEAGESR